VHEWDFGIAGARRLIVRGHFSPIPGSGPSTALRVRCRFLLCSFFAFGVVGARVGSEVRFLKRAVLCEVGADGADGGKLFHAGHAAC